MKWMDSWGIYSLSSLTQKKKKKENLNSPTALNRLNQRFKTPQSKRPKWQKMKNSIL